MKKKKCIITIEGVLSGGKSTLKEMFYLITSQKNSALNNILNILAYLNKSPLKTHCSWHKSS